MPTDVVMPQMGESIFEGTITKWLKKAGDRVEKDEPLFEISTDKVDAEIPSPVAGVLSEIKVEAGATVQINTVVATVTQEGSGVRDQGSVAAAAAPAAENAVEEKAAAAPGVSAGGTDVVMPQRGQGSGNREQGIGARGKRLLRKRRLLRPRPQSLSRLPRLPAAPMW